MGAKRTLFILNAAVVTALFLAILGFVNAISYEWSTRQDMTEDGVFTLDPLSKAIPKKFKDVAVIRYYATPDRFPAEADFEDLARDVEDKLREYAAASEGKLRLEVVDPREGKKEILPELKDRLEAEGVTVSSYTMWRDDRPFPYEFYSSVRITYTDKSEVVSDITNTVDLEYQVTKALRRLQVREVPKVGFYFSGEEKGFDREGNFTLVQDVLRHDYIVEKVDLGEKDPVPDDIDVLFVAAPDGVPERHKFALDQYLMNGRKVEVAEGDRIFDAKGDAEAKEYIRSPGRVVFLLDVFDPARQMNRQQWGQPPLFSKVESGLSDMLAHWGVKTHSDLVLDLDLCGYGSVPKRVFVPGLGFIERPERVRWPRIILSKNENYSKDLAFVNRLDNIAFSDACSISAAETLPAGVTFEPIIRSSKKSWRIDFANAPFIMGINQSNPEKSVLELHNDPDTNQQAANPEGVQYVLAGLWQGAFSSFFAGKAVPAPAPKKPDAGDPEPEPPAPEVQPPAVVGKAVRTRLLMKGDQVLQESSEDATSRVVVVGDSQVFGDFILRHQHAPNEQFFSNLIEWLTTEESLSRIRSKGFRPRPLDYDPGLKGVYIALIIGAVPLLVILLGAGVLAYRWADKVIWLKALAGPAAHAESETPAAPDTAEESSPPVEDSPGNGGASEDGKN